MNGELYLNWLHHYAKHVKPTANDPGLLVSDNHSCHISIKAYDFCKTNHIHTVSLPFHMSYRLQLLDLTCFGPLRNTLYREYALYQIEKRKRIRKTVKPKSKSKVLNYEKPDLTTQNDCNIDGLEKVYFTIPSSRFYEKDKCQEPEKIMLQSDSEGNLDQSPKIKKARRKEKMKKKLESSGSSEVSDDMDDFDICDDDELDDIDLSYVPSDEKTLENVTCEICGEQGKTELRCRCVA